MPQQSSCVSSPITSTSKPLLKLSLMVKRRIKVTHILSTNPSSVRFVNHGLQLSGIFLPCYWERELANLPKYLNVHLNKRMPLFKTLWSDTEGSQLLSKLQYRPMPSAAGFMDLTVEKLGYL